jgi:hypothetical protein
MTAVLVRAALASYPPWWRNRCAQEVADLTAKLRPGEVLLGVIDGTCGSSYLLQMRRQGWMFFVAPPVVALAAQGPTVRVTILFLTLGAVFLGDGSDQLLHWMSRSWWPLAG